MAVEQVSSIDDARLTLYRAVREPSLAKDHGIFVIEGRLTLERAIALDRYPIASVLLTETARSALGPQLEQLDPSIPVFVVVPAVMAAVTGFHIHRGCLALGRRPAAADVSTLLTDARLLLVLDRVGDADNVGGIFRSAQAFGVDAVLLSPASCDPLYRKAIRTSVGATLAVPFGTVDPWPSGLGRLKDLGFALVGLSPRWPSVPLDRFLAHPLGQRVALVVGSEGEGLSRDVEAMVDAVVRIPIARGVDSLNVAVAAAIALERVSTTLGKGTRVE